MNRLLPVVERLLNARKSHSDAHSEQKRTVRVSEKVRKTAALMQDLFGKERTHMKVRCDAKEVYILFRVKNSTRDKIGSGDFEFIFQIATNCLDARIVESRIHKGDSIFRFQTTCQRVAGAIRKAEMRRRLNMTATSMAVGAGIAIVTTYIVEYLAWAGLWVLDTCFPVNHTNASHVGSAAP